MISVLFLKPKLKKKQIQICCTYFDVSHSVVVKIRAGREPFSANAALVRLFATVYPPMGVQGTRRRETLAANGANMRFFACKIACKNIYTKTIFHALNMLA